MIRTVTSEDLGACARLFVKVFSEWPYEESWRVAQAYHYLGRFWRFDPGHCLVAVENDNVVGAMFGYSYPWQDRINYYMQELFVEPDRRRSGHGRSLVRHLLDTLGESDASVSLIANEATPAAAFYQELGLRQHRYYKFYCGTVNPDAE